MDKQTTPAGGTAPGPAYVLVAYATKHGSTRDIAESIAETLRRRGARADVREVGKIQNLTGYDACVIGSAVYFGFWRKEAVRFVRDNSAALAGRPVWLFSSGPVGTKTTDPQGRDLLEVAEPKVINEFRAAIAPRDHRVFFGALDLGKLGFAERMLTKMPASKELFAEGDFRDQAAIRAWATGIAEELGVAQPAAHS
jgi:menaquinone-dependent protoporphyrinogen oxidase